MAAAIHQMRWNAGIGRLEPAVAVVIVGAELFSSTEIAELSRRSQSTGRDLVDVEVAVPVDWPNSVGR
jgi:hypothetical protein